jgi:hypothetical protein
VRVSPPARWKRISGCRETGPNERSTNESIGKRLR